MPRHQTVTVRLGLKAAQQLSSADAKRRSRAKAQVEKRHRWHRSWLAGETSVQLRKKRAKARKTPTKAPTTP